MRAMLTASVPELARPTNSSMIFGIAKNNAVIPNETFCDRSPAQHANNYLGRRKRQARWLTIGPPFTMNERQTSNQVQTIRFWFDKEVPLPLRRSDDNPDTGACARHTRKVNT